MICLHAFLFLHRLKLEAAPAAQLGQRLFDTMFADFDRSLREMGTGDLSVGRQVKRMAQAFFGRIDAYERGLSGGDAVLKPALARGEIQCIGATTLDEYRKYIEKDSALARRFQEIIVDAVIT